MIFGTKTCDKLDMTIAHPWFAWYPVQLNDGRTAWLETVKRRLPQAVL